MLSLLGLIGGLLLLIVLTIRGMNLFIAAPLCALIVALTSGLPIFIGDLNFVETYMQGFSGFVASWFFMFLLGSLFGKFMEDTGAADAVAARACQRMLCCAVKGSSAAVTISPRRPYIGARTIEGPRPYARRTDLPSEPPHRRRHSDRCLWHPSTAHAAALPMVQPRAQEVD